MLAFSKQQRLLRRIEFSRTMDGGVKFVTPHMVLIVRSSGGGLTRVGFIVSKKVGGAVERNRVKRRFREIFRKQLQKPPGCDLVIIARGPALAASYEDLERSMNEGFRRIQLLMEREGKATSRLEPTPTEKTEGMRIRPRLPVLPSQPNTADL